MEVEIIIGILFPFLLQIILILYLFRQHTLVMKKQLLDDKENSLKEFHDLIPKISKDVYERGKITHDTNRYLLDLPEKVIELLNNCHNYSRFKVTEIEHKNFFSEITKLTIDERIKFAEEKRKLAKYSIKNLIPLWK